MVKNSVFNGKDACEKMGIKLIQTALVNKWYVLRVVNLYYGYSRPREDVPCAVMIGMGHNKDI